MSSSDGPSFSAHVINDIEADGFLCRECNLMHYPKTQRLVAKDRDEAYHSPQIDPDPAIQSLGPSVLSNIVHNQKRTPLTVRGPVWQRHMSKVAQDAETHVFSEEEMQAIADEWYGLGDFSTPFLANQWTYGVDENLNSHSRPYKYTAWFSHTMLDLEPDLSFAKGFVYENDSDREVTDWHKKTLHRMMSDLNAEYTDQRNKFYRFKAKDDYFLLAPLQKLYLTVGHGYFEIGAVKDFSGVRMIASFLNYPIKFVDIGVVNQHNLPEANQSNPSSVKRLRFVAIDAHRKEVILLRTTTKIMKLADPVGDFISGCREAAQEGAVMFETHLCESYQPMVRGGLLCTTIMSELRSMISDYGLGMAWYRIPRVKVSAAGKGLVDSNKRTWSNSEPGVFLGGEVYAKDVSDLQGYDDDWLVQNAKKAGIQIDKHEERFLQAALDIAGDPRTRCNVPCASFQARLSAVAQFTLRHEGIAKGLARKLGETIIAVRFVLPLISVRMYGAMKWVDKILAALYDPWWTVIAENSARLRNPFIGHLLGEDSTFRGFEGSWFRAEALHLSPREELVPIVGEDVYRNACAAKEKRFDVEASSDDESHFGQYATW